MLKVKSKYVAGTTGEKYAVVMGATLEDVVSWLDQLGASTMGYKVDGHKFVTSTAFLTNAKLEAGVKMRFYNARSICVAKWE